MNRLKSEVLLCVAMTVATSLSAATINVPADYATLKAAIAAASADDTIVIAPGTYVETGQIVIGKNLTITGNASNKPVIQPAQNTGGSGDARGWWLVNAGVDLYLSYVVLDGTGYNVAQAIRSLGTCTVDHCDFQEIKYPGYNGIGVVLFADGTVSNCTLKEIGRIGIFPYGAGVSSASITGNTYTGKGPGDWLDYGIEVGGGAAAAITGNTITACEGVASSDGSVSAAILVTTYFGAGTTATITDNVITGNSYGIFVGYDSADTSTVTANDNDLAGNRIGMRNTSGSTTLDAEDNWWGTTDADEIAALTRGSIDYDPWQSGPLAVDVLYLEPDAASLYIQPGEGVTVDMNVANLQQKVNACQAMLGYSSTYFADPTGAVVAAGGGFWDQVIWDSWVDDPSPVPGEIDTAIGVNAQGAVGTDADATIAVLSLTSRTGVEGVTRIVFRPDADPDPFLIESTYLSDMSSQPVWPNKLQSLNIVIDGTDPILAKLAATQDQGSGPVDVLNCANTTLQGVVEISVDASDALAGLAGPPVVTVTPQGGSAETATYVDEDPEGTFNYTWTVTSTTPNGTATVDVDVEDKAGNTASLTGDTLCINKNEVTGTVAFDTLSSDAYSVDRDVVFVATDGSNAILKSWTVTVSFSNASGLASGSYSLTDVPSGIANLSAKTAWSLRVRQAVSLDGDGQATADFTGSDKLPGGDLNGSNSVNILDYSILKIQWWPTNGDVADVNGDGQVQLLDYSLMRANWFQVGSIE